MNTTAFKMATSEDFENLWTEADKESDETHMARRRLVARLVGQSVGHRHEIDDVVGFLLDPTCEIEDEALDKMETLARLNQRGPMENANPSKTEIAKHIATICNLAK